jgi:ABC-type Fe3+-hydroxamate transport system substrate-binding protein
MELLDAIGQSHAPIATRSAAPRIVSLVPSITELLCDLGLAQYVVGRTGFCIHPDAIVKKITKIGGTKDVNVEKIRRLAASHLIVNIDENEKPTVDLLSEFIPHVIVTHPIVPSDNLALYRLLGGIFGVEKRAEELCAGFEAAYQQLSSVSTVSTPKTMLYCIWKDPWMTISADTYIANMLGLIGWQTWISPTSQQRYPIFEWDEALLRQIDCVLLSSEPYRFTDQHVQQLEQKIAKPVRLVDGEMLSWYGSRAILGLHYLRQF